MRHSVRPFLRRRSLVGTVVVVTLAGLVFIGVHAGLGSALLNDSRLTAGAVAVVVVVVLVKITLLALGGHRLRNHRSRTGTKQD